MAKSELRKGDSASDQVARKGLLAQSFRDFSQSRGDDCDTIEGALVLWLRAADGEQRAPCRLRWRAPRRSRVTAKRPRPLCVLPYASFFQLDFRLSSSLLGLVPYSIRRSAAAPHSPLPPPPHPARRSTLRRASKSSHSKTSATEPTTLYVLPLAHFGHVVLHHPPPSLRGDLQLPPLNRRFQRTLELARTSSTRLVPLLVALELWQLVRWSAHPSPLAQPPLRQRHQATYRRRRRPAPF